MKQRHNELIELLKEKGELNVAAMVKELNASEATIRRDLIILESMDFLTRTPGGAKLNPEPSLVIKTFEQKQKLMWKEKKRIALEAVKMVKPGMSIAIDSGTTAWGFASLLKDKGPLTVITSALAVVEELGSAENITIILTGGKFRLHNLDFISLDTSSGFHNLHADIAFLGTDSIIPNRGSFSQDNEGALIGNALARCAEKVVILGDSSKISHRGCYQVLASNQINYLITDSGISNDLKKQLVSEPYKLIIV